jgi:hypothetical protein
MLLSTRLRHFQILPILVGASAFATIGVCAQMSAPEPVALPLAHFLFSSWSLGQFFAGLVAILLGIWGINNMTPTNAHTKPIFWVLFSIAVGSLIWTWIENGIALRDADLDKRTAVWNQVKMADDLEDVKKTLGKVQDKLGPVSDGIAKIASAANVPTDKPFAEVVQAIVNKLPHPVTATIKGNDNATAIGAGASATVNKGPPPLATDVYYNGNSVGSVCGRYYFDAEIGFVFTCVSTDRIMRGLELVEFGNLKLRCMWPFDDAAHAMQGPIVPCQVMGKK